MRRPTNAGPLSSALGQTGYVAPGRRAAMPVGTEWHLLGRPGAIHELNVLGHRRKYPNLAP